MAFWPQLFNSNLARYKKWRKIGLNLNNCIVGTLPKELIIRAAKDLGMLGPRETIIFDSEDETSFLMDRAIHDLKTDGRRWIEFYIEKYAANHTEKEKMFLCAKRDAYYSLFEVDMVRRGHGVRIIDLFSHNSFFLMDIGLSVSLSKGYFIATRVLSLDGIHFTAGVVCLLKPTDILELIQRLQKDFDEEKNSITWDDWMRLKNPLFFKKMRQRGGSFKPIGATSAKEAERILSESNWDDNDESLEVEESENELVSQPVTAGPKIGRNNPCPCGSGKKYKKCCLRFDNS